MTGQTRTVSSHEPVRILEPSALNKAQVTRFPLGCCKAGVIWFPVWTSQTRASPLLKDVTTRFPCGQMSTDVMSES